MYVTRPKILERHLSPMRYVFDVKHPEAEDIAVDAIPDLGPEFEDKG